MTLPRSHFAHYLSRLSPVLALLAFWVMLLPPLVQFGYMTCSHDGGMHYMRLAQLDMLWQRGILWPRWAPDMARGYGYPLFNFYPALALYPALILHRLGLTLLAAWNGAFALNLLACGLTMYLWAQAIVGRRSALVAGLAYMLAPYPLYDVYWRGNVTESLTLPLLPLALWAVWRTAQTGRWRYVSIGAVVYAAVLLMHAPAALMLSLVLAAYMGMLVWSAAVRRRIILPLAALVILGLGLAAFFLAPAFIERQAVQFERAITPGGQNYTNHFISLAELFLPAPASDPALINPSPPRSLGWAGLVAGLGLLAAIGQRPHLSRAHKQHTVFAGVGWGGLIMLMLPIAAPLWAAIPLLPFIQFPWRLLGASSVLASLLIGGGAAALDSSRWPRSGRVVGLTAAIFTLTVNALPWLYPRLCAAPANPTLADYADFEYTTDLLGTTSSGEYLPVAVQEWPVDSPAAAAMRAGQPVNRWSAPAAQIVHAHDDGLRAELTLTYSAPHQVIYQAFYFPGWQAELDGQPVALQIIPPLGLLGIAVPAGRHTITVYFADTPVRIGSALISGLCALGLLALAVYDWRVARVQSDGPSSAAHFPRALVMMGLVLSLVKFTLIDAGFTPLRWPRAQLAGVTPSDVMIAERARVLGYSLAQNVDVVFADVYWTLDKPLDLRATVRVLDARGVEWSYKDEDSTALIGAYNSPPPSRQWPPGMYAHTRHAARLLPGTPPGRYQVVLVPFAPNTLDPLPLTRGRSAPGAYPGVVLSEVTLDRVAFAFAPDDFAVALAAPLGDMRLVGYSQDRTEAAPGDAVRLTLGWEALQPPPRDYKVRVDLGGLDVHTVTLAADYPTTQWAAGAAVRTQIPVRIPPRAATGEYEWHITLLSADGFAYGAAKLGAVQVTAPPRVFERPPLAQRVDMPLGDWCMLDSFSAPTHIQAGQTLVVDLVWRAVAETDTDYKTFVHLLDGAGKLIAQSDAVPVGWTRPTAGWWLGEFIRDVHMLKLPAALPSGSYRLKVGMYDAMGTRLRTGASMDALDLGEVIITHE